MTRDTAEAALDTLDATRRTLNRRVVGAGLGIFVTTGGPSTFSTLHVFHVTPSAVAWTNLYPFLAVAAAGVALLTGRLRQMSWREVPWPVFAVAAFVTWSLLSVTWTSTPDTTTIAAMLGVGIAAFGCWIGLCLEVEEHVTSVLLAMTVATVASVLLIVFRPLYGREPVVGAGGGEWMGIYGNRNSLAAVSALGIVAAVGFVAIRPTRMRIAIGSAIALLQLIVLWGTHGDTSRITLVLCTVTAFGIPVLWALRRAGIPGIAVGIAAVAAVGVGWELIFDNMATIAAKVGMDPTLSQRTNIWRYVRSFIRVHPIRGYGYWGFWDNPKLTAVTYNGIGKAYASAHNSVLEVLLMLGVIGLVPYLMILLAAVVGIARWVWSARTIAAWWWGLALVYLVAQNLTESFVLWHSYNWVLFIASSIVPFAGRIDRRYGHRDRVETINDREVVTD
ncbi:MAG: lipid core-O-antigen ligase-like enyme [Acidimicrobiales bacterium]|nr:lipid core-O-antigen ligase-like enyme [Acidimicrobiales bacterium]